MSVNGISPTSTNSYDSPFADRRQKLEALRDALDSGDLKSAQAANSAKMQVASGLQAIGQALNAGDLGAAQKAFAAMRQHRHHGRIITARRQPISRPPRRMARRQLTTSAPRSTSSPDRRA